VIVIAANYFGQEVDTSGADDEVDHFFKGGNLVSYFQEPIP